MISRRSDDTATFASMQIRSHAEIAVVARHAGIWIYMSARPNPFFDAKTARFWRAVFRFTNLDVYSPPPNRRDHHPARRG
jgi:hypothetical protein